MTRIGIIGATGYTGSELVRILTGHPDVELTVLTSRRYEGTRFDRVYPSLRGYVDLTCEAFSMDRVCDRADFIFTALPHSLPMQYIPELMDRGKKVVDLSADFRFKNAATYESFYQPHTAADLLQEAVYGLCEVNASKIRDASLVGNPGCYPTSILLPLIPLVKDRLIDIRSIIADAKSGVSGAGRSVSLTTHFCEANESFKAYKIATHRHSPEMDEILSSRAGEPVHISFVPHLVPITRGMLSTLYINLNEHAAAKDIRESLSSYYAGRAFVRIRPDDQPPDTHHVRGTNYCDIGLKMDERANRMIIISVIDNLVKGASGQAVQNMNLMLGLDETRGLLSAPFPV